MYRSTFARTTTGHYFGEQSQGYSASTNVVHDRRHRLRLLREPPLDMKEMKELGLGYLHLCTDPCPSYGSTSCCASDQHPALSQPAPLIFESTIDSCCAPSPPVISGVLFQDEAPPGPGRIVHILRLAAPSTKTHLRSITTMAFDSGATGIIGQAHPKPEKCHRAKEQVAHLKVGKPLGD